MPVRCTLRLIAAVLILALAGIGSARTSPKVDGAAADTLVFICHPDWHAGDRALEPDSPWEESTRNRETILSDMRRYGPRYLLLAGDMIGGDWLGERRAYLARRFAPGGTDDELVYECATFLYEAMNRQFRSFGMEPVASLGDHDLGDQNWPQGSPKAGVIDAYKRAFAAAYTLDAEGKSRYDGLIGGVPQRPVGTAYENTSYAFVDGNVLFVTIDIFRFEGPDTTLDPARGVLSIELAPEQKGWLDRLLTEAAAINSIQFTVVQAHHPVLTPMRKLQTSCITVKDYENSSFWRLLQKHNVDVYISGEMHALTPMVDVESRIAHIVCGSLKGHTAHNYLVCRASDRRLKMTVREKAGDGTEFIYESTGEMIIDKASGQKMISGSGRLEPIDADRILFHYAFDQEDLSDGVYNSGQFGSKLYVGMPSNLSTGEGFLDRSLIVGGEAPGYFSNPGKCPTDYDCPRTLAAWVNTGQTDKGTVWALGRDDYCLYVNDGVLELGVKDATLRAVGAAALNDRAWHHIAAVYPGGPATLEDVALYVDGKKVACETGRPDKMIRTNPHHEAYVGAHQLGAENPYHGLLDDMGLWVSALSDAEISSLHAAASAGRLKYNASQMDSLFGLFDEGTGDITVKGTVWTVTQGLKGSPGDLLLNESGQYELVLDDEGKGMSTRGQSFQ
ncbi:LamG-like jellyroll fold domain-containing protein [Candidatus Eisenbacteria bacterium]|uniref:LamG-like jellyroll fold domain-containing protein n=1 Tax=Eiseniibacteriota bacterium TaxID=2212470 RepID=A0ABV6YP43_UNCEI